MAKAIWKSPLKKHKGKKFKSSYAFETVQATDSQGNVTATYKERVLRLVECPKPQNRKPIIKTFDSWQEADRAGWKKIK